MAGFLVCTVVLGVVPMALLNPMGRSAFLGYYLGVVTMWLAAIALGRVETNAAMTLRTRHRT